MNIKYLLALGLLIGTVAISQADDATETTYGDPTTTSCEPTTKPTRATTPKPTTKPAPSYQAGVNQYVTKCQAALKYFVGPTYNTAETILNAFLGFIPKVLSLTGSYSRIISENSVAILNAISLLSNVGGSPSGILLGLEPVLPGLLADYTNIILDLEPAIGMSTSDVIDALTGLEAAILQIIADYKNSVPGQDIDFKPVLKSLQTVTNAVADISDSALKNCNNDDTDVSDALYILTLILDHLVIKVHAIIVSVAAILNIQLGGISKPWSQCLKVLDNLLNGITKALNAVVNTALAAVVALVKAIVGLAKSLNTVLKSVFGLVEGVTQTVSNTVTGLTNSLTNILKLGK